MIILTVNKGFEDFLMNWVCFAARIPSLDNYIVYSVDEDTTARLKERGVTVYMPKGITHIDI